MIILVVTKKIICKKNYKKLKLKTFRYFLNILACFIIYENHDIAIAMSPSRAYPVLPWLGLFKYLNQCHCPGWRYLNIYISVTALAGVGVFKYLILTTNERAGWSCKMV